MTNAVEFDKNEAVTESVNVAPEVGATPGTEAPCAAEREIRCEMSQELLERLLAIAQRHRKEGNIQRAKELFWTLIEEHAETPQADTARAELSALTEGFASAAASLPMLEHLLVMAQRYRKEGNIQRAKELFWTVVEEHAETPQADMARAELSALAEGLASAAASQPLLEHLLVMAQRYRKELNLREATELFWSLVEEHPDTPQANAAKLELQQLAKGYERAGAPHMARSIYERLLDLES